MYIPFQVNETISALINTPLSKLGVIESYSIETTIKHLELQKPIINIDDIITVDNTLFIGVKNFTMHFLQ